MLIILTTSAVAQGPTNDFDLWLNALRVEARAAEISSATLHTALARVKQPQPKVISLDRNQPERVQTLKQYVETRICKTRIAIGRRMMDRYPTWGRPVSVPATLDSSLLGLGTSLPLSRWQALGVRRSNGSTLPRQELEASLLMPDGRSGPGYLVYDNFRALLAWNRSNAFAIAVGTLSDRIAEKQK